MQEIYCDLNIFSLRQKIYKIDTTNEQVATEIGQTTIDIFPEVIRNMCKEHNIYKLHLFGNDTYANEIANDVKIYNELKYANEKEIEIEVN